MTSLDVQRWECLTRAPSPPTHEGPNSLYQTIQSSRSDVPIITVPTGLTRDGGRDWIPKLSENFPVPTWGSTIAVWHWGFPLCIICLFQSVLSSICIRQMRKIMENFRDFRALLSAIFPNYKYWLRLWQCPLALSQSHFGGTGRQGNRFGGKWQIAGSCLGYYAHRKMIAVKMMFVRFRWGKEQILVAAPPAWHLWLRAWWPVPAAGVIAYRPSDGLTDGLKFARTVKHGTKVIDSGHKKLCWKTASAADTVAATTAAVPISGRPPVAPRSTDADDAPLRSRDAEAARDDDGRRAGGGWNWTRSSRDTLRTDSSTSLMTAIWREFIM